MTAVIYHIRYHAPLLFLLALPELRLLLDTREISVRAPPSIYGTMGWHPPAHIEVLCTTIPRFITVPSYVSL